MSTVPTTPPDPDAARAYTKRMRWAGELKFALFFATLLFYGFEGFHHRVALFAESLTHSFVLQLLLCWCPLWLILTVASLPAAFFMFHLHRHFGLLAGTFATWLRDLLKAHVIGFVTGAALIDVAFLFNSALRSFGWLSAALTYSLPFFFFTQSLPWLMSFFYPLVPLADTCLRDRLAALATRARLRLGTVYEWKISARTRQANALVGGVGSARRILLTDTLISKLSPDEVEAIVAHELGHSARHHVARRIVLLSGIFAVLFLALDFAVRNGLVCFAGSSAGGSNLSWSNLDLVPGFFLYWTVGRLYGNLVLAALARRQEKEADLYAWNLIGRIEPFVTGLRKISDANLIVYDKKSEWKYLHPSIAGRLAAAEQFAKSRGEIFSVPQPAAPVGN